MTPIDYMQKRENLNKQMYDELGADYFKNWKSIPMYKTKKDYEFIVNDILTNGGRCVEFSFLNWNKHKNKNAKRVRGYLNKNILKKTENENTTHYWIEINNYVLTTNGFEIHIIPKDEYYKVYDIIDVEYAHNGLFLHPNSKLGVPKDDIKGLLELISIK